MSTASLHPPPSPGVGARRKGPKTLPKLPLSVFTPPNTGASDKFPLPPSPSAVHPQAVIDAQVVVGESWKSNISKWVSETGQLLGSKAGGIVVALPGQSAADAEKIAKE